MAIRVISLNDKNITLNCLVDHQSIFRDDEYRPVENSKQYLKIHFDFNDDWLDYINATEIMFGNEEDIEYAALETDDDGYFVVVPNKFIKAPGFYIEVISGKDQDLTVTTQAIFIPVLTEYPAENGIIPNGFDAAEAKFKNLFVYDQDAVKNDDEEDKEPFITLKDYIISLVEKRNGGE